MKKRFFWLLFFALFVITCFSFSACTEVADLGIKDPSAADPDSGKDKNSVCTTHIDIDKNKKCDKCGVDFIGDCATHKDSDDDHKCDYCAFVIGECRDENIDGICDACGKILKNQASPCVECVDHDDDGYCDVCYGVIQEYVGAKKCKVCIDSNYDKKCDYCGYWGTISEHECNDENGDDFCDLCFEPIRRVCENCIDEDSDGYCDFCRLYIHTKCIDVNFNQICDFCRLEIDSEKKELCNECIDENDDGWCDVCGFIFFTENRSIFDAVENLYTDEWIYANRDETYRRDWLLTYYPKSAKVLDDSMRRCVLSFDEKTGEITRTWGTFYEYGMSYTMAYMLSPGKIKCFYHDENGSCTGSGYYDIASFRLEELELGVTTASEVEELDPNGDYWYKTTSSTLNTFSRHYTDEGYFLELTYSKETWVLIEIEICVI